MAKLRAPDPRRLPEVVHCELPRKRPTGDPVMAVLPLATPGILTGLIIGLGQALGESAPLLLIGMVAFVREYPGPPPEGLFDPAAALPVQVYSWTTRGDPAFFERASGAIIVLLVFLFLMNIIAIILRRRFERRW